MDKQKQTKSRFCLCLWCLSSEIDFQSCLTAPELQCNFERGLCNWKQEQSGGDVFDWTRIQGPTPSFDTGPWKDHTLGTSYGHYLYIESSVPQVFKDTAVLLSRVFQPTHQRGKDPSMSRQHCVFRFHYHMFGSHVFCLGVYLRTTATGRGHMLWVRYGDQGNLWHRKTLYLNSARPFQVTIILRKWIQNRIFPSSNLISYFAMSRKSFRYFLLICTYFCSCAAATYEFHH